MEPRSLEAIDADLVLVEHEISLAEPHRQQCSEVYATLANRREALAREREEAVNPSRMTRLPAGYHREVADASGVLPGEGVKSDAQPIRISGHGGKVVFDEPAKEWVGAGEVRKESEKQSPPADAGTYGPTKPFGLSNEQERAAFFKDLQKPEHAELRPLKENVYRKCVEHSSAKGTFCWGIDEKLTVKIGHERVHKDFYPKVKELLEDAEKDLAEDRKAGDARALAAVALGVASGCRNASEQLKLWGQGFILNLYREAQVSISGPKDSRILEDGKQFRIDHKTQESLRIAQRAPTFALESEEAKVDGYEIQWRKQVKKGKKVDYVDCELKEATHVLIRNAAILRLMKGGLAGQDAADYLCQVMRSKIGTPGYSRHQLGIAVDFSPPEKGLKISSNMANVNRWKRTWLFEWLTDGNAEDHDMKNYKPEPWHWEDKSAGR